MRDDGHGITGAISDFDTREGLRAGSKQRPQCGHRTVRSSFRACHTAGMHPAGSLARNRRFLFVVIVSMTPDCTCDEMGCCLADGTCHDADDNMLVCSMLFYRGRTAGEMTASDIGHSLANCVQMYSIWISDTSCARHRRQQYCNPHDASSFVATSAVVSYQPSWHCCPLSALRDESRGEGL